MDLLNALILGAVQGVTEFLPVSSSGHLRLGALLLGVQEPDLLFDIVLHVGTLIAVCLVYRDALVMIVRDLLRALRDAVAQRSPRAALTHDGARLTLLLIASTLPTAVVGLLLKDWVESHVSGAIVGGFLILNGVLLLGSKLAERPSTPSVTASETVKAETPSPSPWSLWGIGLASAALIGVAQGIAALPGISRSGSTITVCLMLGVDREQAARYSFLLSIPAILGALVLKLDTSLFTADNLPLLGIYLLGAAVSSVVGLVCLKLLIRLLRDARFHHFAWYCFAAGAAAIIATLTSQG